MAIEFFTPADEEYWEYEDENLGFNPLALIGAAQTAVSTGKQVAGAVSKIKGLFGGKGKKKITGRTIARPSGQKQQQQVVKKVEYILPPTSTTPGMMQSYTPPKPSYTKFLIPIAIIGAAGLLFFILRKKR